LAVSDEFRDEFEDLLDTVLRADHETFGLHLTDFIAYLDASPESKPIVDDLEAKVDFEDWYEKALTTRRGMVGSGKLDWSQDRQERHGQFLGLLRFLAADEQAPMNFSMQFAYAGNNFNDNLYKLNNQYIEPFSRRLLKHIEAHHNRSTSVSSAPASDRVVPLNHNSSEYLELISKLDEITRGARSENSLAAEPEFVRVESEIEAGKRLLEADGARAGVMERLLVPPLKWIMQKIAEQTIKIAVTAALVLIASLFGFGILGI